MCCVCGGGVDPSLLPTHPSISQPKPNCVDWPLSWHDINGTTYNCEWYARGDNCVLHGNCCANYKKTANEVCWFCFIHR